MGEVKSANFESYSILTHYCTVQQRGMFYAPRFPKIQCAGLGSIDRRVKESRSPPHARPTPPKAGVST